MNGNLNPEISPRENLLYRTLLALAMIVIAAVLRAVPHPWNFTPIGAMALFSGAIVKDRRLAFAFPLVALFVGDVFVGFYSVRIMLFIYASFLCNVAIGLWLRDGRTVGRISAATLFGAIQFFFVSNFAMWISPASSYAHTRAGLLACYTAAIPFFWNTLGGDAVYSALFFGGFALAERFFPVLRDQPSVQSSI